MLPASLIHSLRATIRTDDQEIQLKPSDNFTGQNAGFVLQVSEDPHRNCLRVQIRGSSEMQLAIRTVALTFSFDYTGVQSIFCNGFQSWSESREYAPGERLPALKWFARPLMRYYGDAHFQQIPRRRRYFHSWTYSYIRTEVNDLFFIASVNEKNGFTWIGHDLRANTLTVNKDCTGLILEESALVLDLLLATGTEAAVFDAWFSEMDVHPSTAPLASGWTSWYNYYTAISESILLQNLASQSLIPREKRAPQHFFQIDDGYQTHVGDWLDLKPDFPSGMAAIAASIHAASYQAGLWVAPFICEQHSALFREHPEWLLRDGSGKPVRAGWNPLWSGWFYALDFYNIDFREGYLRPVLTTMLHEWNFDLLKLDFLYAVCILPRPDKTRGQVMHEAMLWLREVAGNKWLLGCGVPLGSAFGLVDYCRIGADIHLRWEHKLLRFLGNRERVSTLLALRNAIGRRHLDGKVWRNDPDVFLLRRHNLHLSEVQKRSILIINALCGGLLFTSDELDGYDTAQWELAKQGLGLLTAQLLKVSPMGPDLYRIDFEQEGEKRQVICNLNATTKTILWQEKPMVLQPFETRFVKPDTTALNSGVPVPLP